MATPRLDPQDKKSIWTLRRDHELTELVSTDRYSFRKIGEIMGLSKRSVIGRFYRIAARIEGRVQG